jgi:hypothetical protein|tara:strand:- start:1529 stop:1726 length:198 start_codon:yes stop_codon:yes gene_type:complete
VTADRDAAELFHHLMAQITGVLEDAATLASDNQTGALPDTIAPLIIQVEKALILTRAAQTIVDRT